MFVPDVPPEGPTALSRAQELDDARLMDRVRNDDTHAFEALYDRYAGRAYRLARQTARDDSRAQDVVQETFISIWRSRASYAPERGSVAAWILGMVRNRGVDALRRHGRHDSRRADSDAISERRPAAGDLANDVAERDQAARLRSLLAELPETQRHVIALAYFGEMSTSEIAHELSVPHGTVKGRMRLGLHRLRDKLVEPGPQLTALAETHAGQ